VQQQAPRHVVALNQSVFFAMAECRTTTSEEMIDHMTRVAGIFNDLGENIIVIRI
jgi:hypothetical protein